MTGDETADGDDSEGSCYQASYKCLTATGRPPLSAPGSSDSDDEVADKMGSESDSEPLWLDSGSWDLSRAIAYGVLTALDRSPESFNLSSLSSSSSLSSATSLSSWSAFPVADEGGLSAAVRPSRTAIKNTITDDQYGRCCPTTVGWTDRFPEKDGRPCKRF